MKLTLAALLGMLVIGSSCFARADVYKWVDDKGEVHYSDRRHPGAEEMKNLDVPIYVSPPRPLPALAKSEPQPQTAKGYESVAITRPGNDEAIRSNNGDVSVSVAVLPELYTNLGHRLGVLLDGALIAEPGNATEFQLNNIERGSHTVQAVVFEAGGKPVAQSVPITVHLQRQATFRPGTNPGEQNFNPAGRFRPADNFPAPNFPAPCPGAGCRRPESPAGPSAPGGQADFPFKGPGVTQPR